MFPALRSQLTQNGCCSTSTVATRKSTLNVAQVFAARRSISSTATLQAEADLSSTESSSVSQDGAGAASTTESSEVQESTGTKSSSSQGRGFTAWLDGDGARYRNPIKGRTNWLGETPFPLNPTFRPLPPLADTVKTKIYNAYTYNILAKDATDSQVVRAVAAKFGVAMDRVKAVIRLKELEKSWKEQGITLQTNLLENMESYLGVKQPVSSENWRGQEALVQEPAYASNKTLFEMVDVESGDVPVSLPLLADLPDRKPGDAPAGSERSSSPTQGTAKATVIPASRPGRAATVFVDVGPTAKGEQWRQTYNPNKTKKGKRAGTTTAGSKPRPSGRSTPASAHEGNP